MAEAPPLNIMMEHLLQCLYGVESPAVKYVVNVKNL